MSEKTEKAVDKSVIAEIGRRFTANLEVSRFKAWNGLMIDSMERIADIADTGQSQALREIIGMVMDIDKMLGGVSGDKASAAPPTLDAITKKWVIND